MHNNAVCEVVLAENPGAVALVGESSFRLKPTLLSALQESSDNGGQQTPILCAQSLTDLVAQLREDQTHDQDHGENPFRDLVLYLFLPTTVESPHNWLGAACRLAPKLVVVEHAKSQSTDNLLEDEQFFAHGFRKIKSEDDSPSPQTHWYAYSLREYKQAPDWLNARFWAHPERFGLLD